MTLAATAALALPAVAAQAADTPYEVLVFSKTAGFRHSSIAVGIQTIQALGAANSFTVTATENAALFTAANLAQYEAVIFLNTTGDVLNATQQTAFESYIAAGGGYVGVHAAADTEYSWPFYGNLMGAWFLSHPAQQNATVTVEDRTHPATVGLPQTITRFDEWYNYRTNPRSTARVLASLNESSYSGGTMNGDHPITWCKEYAGGRSFYTGMGHTQATYSEANFRALLLGGIRYVARQVDANCTPGSPGVNVTVQAEAFSAQSGVQVVSNAGAIGGQRLGRINAGDWAAYNGVNVGGGRSLQTRVSSGGNGGTLQLRTGSSTGPILGSVAVPNTGGWNNYTNVTTTLTGVPSGTANVYLTFAGTGSLFDVDQFTIVKS
jgi:type 1 glutamine amidotransferase